jgi:ABC-type branched-subunit amino acid transport system permease subunit
MRVHGDTVAIVTLGMALAFQALVLSNPTFTGGLSGVHVPSPTLFGILDAVTEPTRFAAFHAVVVLLCGLPVANIRRGSAGRRLIATRCSERAAETLGISVKGAKLYAFAIAGGLAGLAGAVQAFSQPTLTFDGFTIDASMALLVAVVLSGAGYVAAGQIAGFAVTGGLVYYVLSLTGWQRFLPLALGLLLLVNLVLVPDGVIPQNGRKIRSLLGRLNTRRRSKSALALSTLPAVTNNPVRGSRHRCRSGISPSASAGSPNSTASACRSVRDTSRV